MTRRPKSPSSDEETSKPSRKSLPDPYPSAPHRPGKYCFYVDKEDRQIVMIFAALYAAKHFFDYVVKGENWKWAKQDYSRGVIVTESGVVIKMHLECLEEVVEKEFSQAEEEWELDEWHKKQVIYIKEGVSQKIGGPGSAGEDDEPNEKPRREKRERTPRPDRTGLVSVGDIAAEMKIEPRDARAALRKQKIEKPDAGWAWPASEVPEIKKVITKGLTK